MKMDVIINSVESAFRYLLPGFLFVFLLKMAYPSIHPFLLANVGKIEFAILIPCLGMMVYGIHRTIYWVLIDFILWKCCAFPSSKGGWKYADQLAAFIQWRYQNARSPCVAYLHYRWAILHYCLILSELVFVFSLLNEKESFLGQHCKVFLVASAGLWVLTMVHYVFMLLAEKKVSSEWEHSQGVPQPATGESHAAGELGVGGKQKIES